MYYICKIKNLNVKIPDGCKSVSIRVEDGKIIIEFIPKQWRPNSGDLNSGYRNSGIFCNRKRSDTVILFNKESKMTWDEWENNSAYDTAQNLKLTEWIYWDDMTDIEKADNKSAFVCNGYLKVYEYKEAWANLWKTLDEDGKNSFKALPNFDADVFEDITGIKF